MDTVQAFQIVLALAKSRAYVTSSLQACAIVEDFVVNHADEIRDFDLSTLMPEPPR